MKGFEKHYKIERYACNWPMWEKRIYNCVICEKEIYDEEVLGSHYK